MSQNKFMREKVSSVLKSEGGEQQKRFTAILVLAKSESVKGGIQDTALVQDRPFDSSDVTQVRLFLTSAAPYTGKKLFPNYWEHILLTSVYAKILAERVGAIDPYQSEVVGLLHDVGRLVVPHRYGRNDAVGKVFLTRAHVRLGIVDSIAPLDRILGMQRSIRGVEDLTLEQRINHIADNLGRRDANGVLLTVEGILQLSSGRRYTNPIWPSEKNALDYLNREGREEWANQLVCNEALYFMIQNGVDFDEVKEAVDAEFNKADNQEWLRKVQSIPKLVLSSF